MLDTSARSGIIAGSLLAHAEWEHIMRVLEDCDGNVTNAARKLGIHRSSLQRKLRRALPPDEEPPDR